MIVAEVVGWLRAGVGDTSEEEKEVEERDFNIDIVDDCRSTVLVGSISTTALDEVEKTGVVVVDSICELDTANPIPVEETDRLSDSSSD